MTESGMMSKHAILNSYLNSAFELPGKFTLRIDMYRMNCKVPIIPNSMFKACIISRLTKKEPIIVPRVSVSETSVAA